MNKNIKKKSILKVMKDTKPALEEAKLFSVPIEVSGNNVVIKLPKVVLKYLNLEKDSNLNIVPINNTLQLTGGKSLTFIPALDLQSLSENFVAQSK